MQVVYAIYSSFMLQIQRYYALDYRTDMFREIRIGVIARPLYTGPKYQRNQVFHDNK